MDAASNLLTGKKESLRRRLRRRQHDIVACHCGRLTDKRTSAVMEVARQSQFAARGRPAAGVPAAALLSTGAGGSCPSSPESGTQPSERPFREGDSSDGSAHDAPVRRSGAGAGHAAGRAKSVPMSTIIKSAITPLWLLRRVCPMPAAYAAVLPVIGAAAADPSPEAMHAGLRKYITILRCLIMRTQTTEYAR